MTKKKRELIDILLDNITPEDWPERLPFATQEESGNVYGYEQKPKIQYGVWNDENRTHSMIFESENGDTCRHQAKTIVHRDEFMKRWNERHPVVDQEGWIQWNGREMPVERGTLIDVKYRDGVVNLHVKAGEHALGGSISERCAIDFKHDDNPGGIIAYRLHAPQQLALEKFGTDWHDNEGVQPVDDEVLIDAIVETGTLMRQYQWNALGLFKIQKWRIHSETNATTPPAQQELHTEETKPIQQEVKSTDTQIGGNHYTKLAIQPMQYSMANNLDALQHTVIKYVTRFRDKNGVEDLEKAKHCIDMLIEFEKESK